MVQHWCLNYYFWTQKLHITPSQSQYVIISFIAVSPLLALTGDSQYFKLEGGVLYHPSSGQIYLTSGQDPLHSDDDVTQYMQHSLLWSTASSLSSIAVILPSNHFASIQIASIQADHPWTQTPSADSHEDQLSSTHLMTLAQSVAPIIVEEMWRKCSGRERQ